MARQMRTILANLYCKIVRKITVNSLPIPEYFSRKTRWARKPARRIGIYSAYYDSSAYLSAHLNSLMENTTSEFDYYIMKNFSRPEESRRFDEIMEYYSFAHVFRSIAGCIPCPLRHGDSLQRMVSLTDNEIIVICDIDTLFLGHGWDEYVLKQLEDKTVVGVVTSFEGRTQKGQLPTVLHPSFMAFRRKLLEDNQLDLLSGEGNDPAYKITRFLVAHGAFDDKTVCPLLPTRVEYPNEWFSDLSLFGLGGQPSHGFCTHYGDFFFHFWHSMNYAQGTDIMAADGTVLVPHSVVKQKVKYYTGEYRSR